MRSMRATFIAAASLWAITTIAVTYLLRQHSIATRIGSETALAGGGLALCVWFKHRHDDAIFRVTWFGVVAAVIIIGSWMTRDWVSLLLIVWFVWLAREYIINVAGSRGQTRAASVNARALAGIVEYDSMQFSGILVEECSSDWGKQLSQVKTDSAGHFALPDVSDGGVHYLRISWPGTQTVYLRVTITEKGQPLLVTLKPMKPKTVGDWGSD